MSHLRRILHPMKRNHVISRLVHTDQLEQQNLNLADALLRGERHALARCITLAESQRADHMKQAELLVDYVAQRKLLNKGYQGTPYTLRLGVAGPPGAGKSTFIENIGMKLVAADTGNKVAVIPVDSSSHISGGSILGDMTRMENLSKSDRTYVRASPTRGVLGGVAEHTSEVISLCESGGYNVVIVESVGLGQSEVEIDRAVDMLVLLVPPGGGDGLQASKKGIMEAADLVIVNKADGSLLTSAKQTKADYASAMFFVRQKYDSWQTPVMLASAGTDSGIYEVLETINKFHQQMVGNGCLQQKRAEQSEYWMQSHLQRQMMRLLTRNESCRRMMEESKQSLLDGTTTPRAAASKVMTKFVQSLKDGKETL